MRTPLLTPSNVRCLTNSSRVYECTFDGVMPCHSLVTNITAATGCCHGSVMMSQWSKHSVIARVVHVCVTACSNAYRAPDQWLPTA